jgi:EpsI family protein
VPSRAALIAGAALAAVACASPLLEPHRMLARELPPLHLEADVPSQFGGWHVDDSMRAVLPSPDVQRQMDEVYSQQLSRTYVNAAGQHVMLVIAYGEDQVGKTSVAHLPDACYPAQGFIVSQRAARPVPLAGRPVLPVNRLVATKSNRIEPITYWTVVGNSTFASDFERRVSRLTSAVEGVIPDGMLVRVSTIDADESRAFAVQDEFVAALRSALTAQVQPRVFGASPDRLAYGN